MRPLNRKEHGVRRWWIGMRILRPIMLALILLAWVAIAPTHMPLLVAMAAGDVLLDASGNVILDDDGNVVLDDGAGNACCCDTCKCTVDGSPDANTYMLVSMAPTFCCAPDGFGGSIKLVDYPGTWCLASAVACQWQYFCVIQPTCSFTSGHINTFSTSTCTGTTFGPFALLGLGIRVIKDGANWSLIAWAVAGGSTYVYVPCCTGTAGSDLCEAGTITFSGCGASCGGPNTVTGCISPAVSGYILSTAGSFSFTLQDTPC